jgi:hypothetical protein
VPCDVRCNLFGSADNTESHGRIVKPDIKHFFMTLYWLKTYGSEAQLAGEFNVDEKTVRKWVVKYVDAMQALKGQKVRAKT